MAVLHKTRVLIRLIAFICFFGCTIAFAQKGRMNIGLTGGYTYSNVLFTSSSGEKSEGIRSPSYGITFQHMSSKYAGIQLAIQLAKKGIYITDGNVFYKRDIDYIEIPLMTHFELGKNNLKFIINLGPQISFAYQSIGRLRDADTLGNALPSIQYLIMETNKSKTFQFGLVAGLGISYKINKLTFQLEGRFYNSFTNILQPGRLSNINAQTFGGYFSLLYNIQPKEKAASQIKNP